VSDYGPYEVAALDRQERDHALGECERLREVLRVAGTALERSAPRAGESDLHLDALRQIREAIDRG
jgi:hypothetical protein